MNSSPAVRTPPSSQPKPNKPRLIIKFGSETYSDHKVTARNYEEDERIAVEALLMLSIPRPSPPPPQKSVHRCTLCGKIFYSHQALGGHMTCHRKKTIAGKGEETSSSKKSDVVSGASDCVEKSDHHRHKCCTCSATFTTGQQLGGHKRKHYQQTTVDDNNGGTGDDERRLLDLFTGGGDVGPIVPVPTELDLDLKLGLLVKERST